MKEDQGVRECMAELQQVCNTVCVYTPAGLGAAAEKSKGKAGDKPEEGAEVTSTGSEDKH